MALLQNDKAIFYHPLDDSTESLKSQAWTLGSGSLAGAGKISLAMSGAGGDSIDAFGAEKEFLSANGASDVHVTALSATKFVVVYRDLADSSKGTAKIGTVSGTDITFGAETEFDTSIITPIAVDSLDASKFVVAYSDAVTGHAKAKVGTVSGTDVTFGAETEFFSAFQANTVRVAALSSTKFVVAYRDGADSNHGTAKAGTVSGTDITFGAETEFLSAGTVGDTSLAALSATGFVVAYADGADSSHGTAKIGTVSGTDITFGAETEFLSAGSDQLSAIALSATLFVVAYADGADSSHGTAKVGTVSGTDITFGAEAEFLSAGAASQISTGALDSARFVVAYRDGADSSRGTAKIGTVSGTDITFGAETEYLSVFAANWNTVATLSAAAFVVAYQDESDSNHGTAKVGAAPPSGADLTATAPAAYDTAAAATKVAFAGWLKNPSA